MITPYLIKITTNKKTCMYNKAITDYKNCSSINTVSDPSTTKPLSQVLRREGAHTC